MGKVCGVNLAVCRAIWGLFGSRLTPLPLEETSSEKVCALVLSSAGSGRDQGVQMPAAGPAVLGTHSGHLLRGSHEFCWWAPAPGGPPRAACGSAEASWALCLPLHLCPPRWAPCFAPRASGTVLLPSALLQWLGRGRAAGSMLRAGVRRSCAKSEGWARAALMGRGQSLGGLLPGLALLCRHPSGAWAAAAGWSPDQGMDGLLHTKPGLLRVTKCAFLRVGEVFLLRI